MAKIYDIQDINKLDWAMPFQRTSAYPLDRTLLFDSIEDAKKYAKGLSTNPDKRGLQGTSYVGQIISVVENNNTYVFKIINNGELQRIDNIIIENNGIYYFDENNTKKLFFKIENDEIYLDGGEY